MEHLERIIGTVFLVYPQLYMPPLPPLSLLFTPFPMISPSLHFPFLPFQSLHFPLFIRFLISLFLSLFLIFLSIILFSLISFDVI